MVSRTISFSIVLSLWALGVANAQDDGFAEVEITVNHVSGNIYYLAGRGGNIGLSVGDDGIVMVDSQFAPLTDKILAAIRTVSEAQIRVLINTHVHPDHIGGNENFGNSGIAILAHDNVRVRMAQGLGGGSGEPFPDRALPIITYPDFADLHFNGENIHVFKVPAAHTDADSFVFFESANVLHLGDVFRTTGYPVIDVANGGTALGTLDALQAVLDMAAADTIIVPGHGEVSTPDDVREFRDMIAEVYRRVSSQVEEGLSFEQVLAARPTEDLDERWGMPERFLTGLYQSIVNESN